MNFHRRRIVAEEEPMGPAAGGAPAVDVDPSATDLLFEAEDVAELLAEVTGEEVEAVADGDAVTFTIGDDEFCVEADGDEEVLESRRVPRSARRVAANRQPAAPARRTQRRKTQPVAAGRVIRKVPRG